MAQWPPSPYVEDEIVALAHECSIDGSISLPKSDDQPAESRGSIDQYPVIIDSPVLERAEKVDARKQTRKEQAIADSSSSDDSAGPATPPPLVRKEEKKSSRGHTTNDVKLPVQSSISALPAYDDRNPSYRGRPQVSRIQTDVGADVHAMASGSRRPPSPYAYTRTPTLPNSSTGQTTAAESFLSPSKATSSPVSAEHHRQARPSAMPHQLHRSETMPAFELPTVQRDRAPNQYREDRVSRDDGYTSRRNSQYHADLRVPNSGNTVSARRSFHGLADRPNLDATSQSISKDRRPSKESSYGSSSEEKMGKHSPSYSRRSTVIAKDSPYSSSTEESSREHGRRSARSSGDEHKKLRRKSSHRRERPIFVDLGKSLHPESAPLSAVDGSERRYYRYDPRDLNQHRPITPLTGDAQKAAMEDYFERAFRENDTKRSQRSYGPRSSGSALVSPMTSPPRTPRSERQSKDYFDLTPTMQRPSQRSRPPSMDEGQIKDLKSHSTLLSAATAGAALAARGSGTSSSRSSGQSTEHDSSTSTSKVASAPRSRRPSPVPEDSYSSTKSGAHGFADQSPVLRGPSAPTSYDLRPGSSASAHSNDGGLFYASHSRHNTQPHPPPHRALSYSGADHNQSWNGSYPASAISPTQQTPATNYHSNTVPLPPRSARTSINPTEVPPILRAPDNLPICPRSQPVGGHRDWYTIKEMSHLDICPTCVSAVNNSRYRELLVPSLPRPYNEPSVCAMSRPWVRIAFLQSMRQNKADLSLIGAVTTGDKKVKPCSGSKPEVKCWYQIEDPQTQEMIPDFYACPACIQAIDEVFPILSDLFDRPKPKLSQERSCSLHVAGKHFHSIIDQLDSASSRCKARQSRKLRSSDIEPLLRHIRKVTRYQPCPRDEMQMSRPWHFMADLPEFTICEECYDEVVWPLADRPIARDISKTLKIVPVRRGSAGHTGLSCQLYSDRMRKVFRDAVDHRDFGPLREAVITRVKTQHRLVEMNKLYEQDLKSGINRSQEVDRNKEIWRAFE